MPLRRSIKSRATLALALVAAGAVAVSAGAAQPATAAKLKFKQPACGKLKKKIGKAKTRTAKRTAKRAHAQCQANMKVYRQVRNHHFEGYRTDDIRIDNVYCANGTWTNDDRVGRNGWRVIDAKVRAGGKRFTAVVEAWIPGGRHVQGIIRQGDVWKIGYEFGGKIHHPGVMTRTNATATCKTL